MQGVSGHAFGGIDTPLRRDSLHQQIYERLHSALISGAYLPGEAVSARGLAQALGVSAMPVREALTRLTAEGALELTSSRTLCVRVLTPEDFDEMTTIRIDLEGMAANRAAGRFSGQDAERVGALHARLDAAAASGDVDGYLAANAAFHAGIYEVAHWPLLLSLIRRLWLTVGPTIRSSVPDRAHMATSMHFHNAALAAMEARDSSALRDAIVCDIRTAAINIRTALAEASSAKNSHSY